MTCEQCGGKNAAYIWSDDGHFPGAYLCSKCVTRPNKKSERLLAARRPRGYGKVSHFTHGLTPKTGSGATLDQKLSAGL